MKQETIFDLYQEPEKDGQEGYFQLAQNAPKPKDNSFFNDLKDYSKTVLKGTVEGLISFGEMMGPSQGRRPTSEEKQQQTEELNRLLPTDEGYVQKSIRKGLGEAPTALAFPGASLNMLPRAIAAGFVGEGAKELGAPEWIQSAAELTAYIGPDITKKLLEKGKNAELIQFGRKMGMTDKEMAPLMNSEFKQKWLTKLSPKRGSTQTALENTKKSLHSTYESLKNSDKAIGEISEKANGVLINDLKKIIHEMPADVSGKIEKDMADLFNNKITGQSLINFYSDINHNLSGNAKQLSLLKDPVKKAISSISPELGKDFGMVNELYTKYYPIASKLKPTLTSDIISAAESLGILGSFTMGYYPPLVSILGEKTAKKAAQQLLINPHLHQLGSKVAKAMNEGKFQIAKKLMDSIGNKMKDKFPEIKQKLDDISEKDIKDLIDRHYKSIEELKDL